MAPDGGEVSQLLVTDGWPFLCSAVKGIHNRQQTSLVSTLNRTILQKIQPFDHAMELKQTAKRKKNSVCAVLGGGHTAR